MRKSFYRRFAKYIVLTVVLSILIIPCQPKECNSFLIIGGAAAGALLAEPIVALCASALLVGGAIWASYNTPSGKIYAKYEDFEDKNGNPYGEDDLKSGIADGLIDSNDLPEDFDKDNPNRIKTPEEYTDEQDWSTLEDGTPIYAGGEWRTASNCHDSGPITSSSSIQACQQEICVSNDCYKNPTYPNDMWPHCEVCHVDYYERPDPPAGVEGSPYPSPGDTWDKATNPLNPEYNPVPAANAVAGAGVRVSRDSSGSGSSGSAAVNGIVAPMTGVSYGTTAPPAGTPVQNLGSVGATWGDNLVMSESGKTSVNPQLNAAIKEHAAETPHITNEEPDIAVSSVAVEGADIDVDDSAPPGTGDWYHDWIDSLNSPMHIDAATGAEFVPKGALDKYETMPPGCIVTPGSIPGTSWVTTPDGVRQLIRDADLAEWAADPTAEPGPEHDLPLTAAGAVAVDLPEVNTEELDLDMDVGATFALDPTIAVPEAQDMPMSSWLSLVPFLGILQQSSFQIMNPSPEFKASGQFFGRPLNVSVDMSPLGPVLDSAGNILFLFVSFLAMRKALAKE